MSLCKQCRAEKNDSKRAALDIMMAALIGNNLKYVLFKVSLEESFHLVVRNHTCHIVVEVHMGGTGDNHDFLVAYGFAFSVAFLACYLLKGCLAKIAAVGFLSVYDGGELCTS